MATRAELREWVHRAAEAARACGLDFFETRFEVVDYATMNELAAYGGFPGRYPHWRFGMEFERLEKSYSYGLHKIYEMVINADPAYAYLLDDNALVDQKLVMAHVFAHVDFFKNNAWFAPTNRRMVDEMANHGARVRRYIEEFGLDEVEAFIDRCLSIENLIDPYSMYVVRRRPEPPALGAGEEAPRPEPADVRFRTKKYMEPFVNPDAVVEQEERKAREQAEKERKYPASERDIVGFLAENAPLPAWQRNILSMIREEAYYFAPQRMTKIMNEGWATYWHSRIMTERLLEDEELIDYADHHSSTVATSPGRLNPYALGLALLRDIKERWDLGRFGKDYDECDDIRERESWDRHAMLGTKKLFEVRRVYNDLMFLDEFLTPEFVARHRLFRFAPDASGIVRVDSREFAKVKEGLLQQLTNLGEPVIAIEDDNHGNRKELLLVHRFEGQNLKRDWAVATLRNLALLWTRPVHLETQNKDRKVLLTHDGKDFKETPA